MNTAASLGNGLHAAPQTASVGNGLRAVPQTADEVLSIGPITHELPLVMARRWIRSGDAALRKEAEKLLLMLTDAFPLAMEIPQELCVAYLERGAMEETRLTLERIGPLMRSGNEEILSRWGRLFKNAGDRALIDEQLAAAERHYEAAADWYGRAFRVRQGHYPGANLATLALLRAAVAVRLEAHERAAKTHELHERSHTLARTLLDARQQKPWSIDLEDDDVWHAATLGELRLLLEDWQPAAEYYQEALRQRHAGPFHVNSMRQQAERIVRAFDTLGIAVMPPFSTVEEWNALFHLRPPEPP